MTQHPVDQPGDVRTGEEHVDDLGAAEIDVAEARAGHVDPLETRTAHVGGVGNDAVDDEQMRLCNTVTELAHCGVLLAAIPLERDRHRRELEDHDPTMRRRTLEHLDVAPAHDVPPARGRDAHLGLPFVLLVRDRIEHLPLIDDVGAHHPSRRCALSL